METLTGPLILVPPTTIYREYFSHAEIDTFCGRYADVLVPYTINPNDAVVAATPADAMQLIYSAAQEGVPTMFLQWNQGARRRIMHIALLH